MNQNNIPPDSAQMEMEASANSAEAEAKRADERVKYGNDLRQRTVEWMRRNPQAVTLFEHYALLKAREGNHFSMQLLVERVRWDNPLDTEGSSFKINNDYAAYLARWLIGRHPQLKELIRLRKVKW